MRSSAWPFLAALALTINACASDQSGLDGGGGGGSGGGSGRGGGGGRGGTGGGTAGSTGGSATGTAGSTGVGAAGSTGGSTAGSGGGTAGSTGGSTAGSGGATGGSTAGSGGGTGGSTAGSGGRGGTGGGTAGSTGGSTAGSTGGSTAGTGGGTAGSTGGSTAGTGGSTAGSTGGSTAGSGGATGTGGGTAGSTGGSTAGSGGATGGSTGTGGTTGTGGSVACTSASTCPGGADDECKHKTCISSFCGIDYTAANTVVTGQTPEDCKRNVCDGVGGVMQAIFDSDPPADDGNVCTSETCVNGIPTHAPEPARTACAQSGGTLCNGSSSAPACVICVAATDCPGTDSICHLRVCGNAYTCGFSNAQAGTAAEVVAGNCRKEQCDGLGGTTTVTDDTDTPTDDGNACTSEVCTSGTPTHPAKPDDTTCSQGAGIVCLGGSCVECRTVADCPGSDTTCRTRTCETNHTCGHMDAPLGTAAGTDATGNCKKPVCDGAGAVTPVADDTDVLVDNDPCTSDLCTNGTPSNPAKPEGTICSTDGSKSCDDVGACTQLTFRILRVGPGTSSAATAVTIEERRSDGSLVGTPIAMPTAVNGANRQLTLSGSASSEGCLSLSGDGHTLALVGYGAPLLTAGIKSTSGNRVVGLVDIAGNVNTSTLFPMGLSGDNARSATTLDGTDVWIGGTGSGSNGGVWASTVGAISGEIRTVASPDNIRCVAIFSGQLFGSSGSSGFTNVFKIGFGTPTAMGTATTALPGMPTTGGSPFAFAMFDLLATPSGLDTMYVADDAAGLQKWTYNGTTWTKVATLNISGNATGFRGVAGYLSGGTVTLMASTAETLSRLVVFTDDGVNPPSGAAVMTAAASTSYRGIALSPHFP